MTSNLSTTNAVVISEQQIVSFFSLCLPISQKMSHSEHPPFLPMSTLRGLVALLDFVEAFASPYTNKEIYRLKWQIVIWYESIQLLRYSGYLTVFKQGFLIWIFYFLNLLAALFLDSSIIISN